jgi:hypothetical protein
MVAKSDKTKASQKRCLVEERLQRIARTQAPMVTSQCVQNIAKVRFGGGGTCVILRTSQPVAKKPNKRAKTSQPIMDAAFIIVFDVA